MVELPMNHAAYAKTIFRSRNFRIQKADLDDVVQSAIVAAIDKGCDINSNPMKGFIFISCMRFIQTSCKNAVKTAGNKVNRAYIDAGLAAVDVHDDMTLILDRSKNLPPYLMDTLRGMLADQSVGQIGMSMGVKPRTVSVNKCRVLTFLRNSIDTAI